MGFINIDNPWVVIAGVLGNIISFLVTLAPMPTFYRICKKRSTESFQSTPYVVAMFSALTWLYYALLTSNILVLTINTITLLIESIYISIFLAFAPKKAKVSTMKLLLFLNLGVFGALVLLTLTLLKGTQRIDIAGMICATFAISVFAAPLSIIKLVIKTKSVEYMPISLSFFLTLSAIAWLSYGVLLKDLFIALPNVVGFMFGIAQMILYCIYMKRKNDDKFNDNSIEPLPITTKSTEMEVIDQEMKSVCIDPIIKVDVVSETTTNDLTQKP
ncbi:solute carrier family 50 (sugar transporter) protein [Dioscorea alata]|uniref:Solute carrier family 50 (Sugar transporter) protein n=1 Tax=Dioscorea alata TaxID=55571 RepID=A0ACB7V0Y6_DIOAL|nr:solute carrier family 50 (sugar transporter) protein [Dioscorea alata]